MTPTSTYAASHAQRLADYSARCDAAEEEGYPHSYEQWSRLNALYREPLTDVVVTDLGEGRSVVAS